MKLYRIISWDVRGKDCDPFAWARDVVKETPKSYITETGRIAKVNGLAWDGGDGNGRYYLSENAAWDAYAAKRQRVVEDLSRQLERARYLLAFTIGKQADARPATAPLAPREPDGTLCDRCGHGGEWHVNATTVGPVHPALISPCVAPGCDCHDLDVCVCADQDTPR